MIIEALSHILGIHLSHIHICLYEKRKRNTDHKVKRLKVIAALASAYMSGMKNFQKWSQFHNSAAEKKNTENK